MTSAPGFSIRWYVLPRTICTPRSARSADDSVRTAPRVPTGMKQGVRISPRAVRIMPARASPAGP